MMVRQPNQNISPKTSKQIQRSTRKSQGKWYIKQKTKLKLNSEHWGKKTLEEHRK